MKKPFTVGNVREIMDAQESGEISYSKMVECLNAIAKQHYCDHSGYTAWESHLKKGGRHNVLICCYCGKEFHQGTL